MLYTGLKESQNVDQHTESLGDWSSFIYQQLVQMIKRESCRSPFSPPGLLGPNL